MKIYKIEADKEKIVLNKPLVSVRGKVEQLEFVRVKVTIDNGSFTVGESVAIDGYHVDSLLKKILEVKDIFVSKELEEAIALLHTKDELSNSVKASFDMAFVILLAQSRSQKLFEYLGLQNPKLMQTSVTINLDTRSKMLQDIKDAVAKKIFILKLKLDLDIPKCVEVIKNSYKLFPNTMLIADPEHSWSKKDSIDFIQLIRNSGIEFIQQPINPNNLEELKEITSYSQFPIATDGTVKSVDDLKAIKDAKSADFVVLKLIECGGVTKIVEILEFMRKNSIKCILGSFFESPFSINTALHVAMAYGDVIKYIELDSPLFYEELSDELEFEYNGSRISYKF
ncbi:MAG: dipeptide epimerase [Campylobacterales bacterium]|nr:dipeptide epimerase [Campylobacterales bacterium]